MKFNVYSYDSILSEASSLIEKHYKDEAFLNVLCTIERFNYTSQNGKMIAQEIQHSDSCMDVMPYKTWNPYSKSIGYAKGNTIYVNTRKLDLSLANRVENFYHESLHLLGYSHSGNKNNEFNRGTVPYKVAEMFRKYLENIGKI